MQDYEYRSLSTKTLLNIVSTGAKTQAVVFAKTALAERGFAFKS